MATKQSKVSKQQSRDIRAHNFYDMGEALGYDDNATEQQWQAALRACKKPADRNALRAGFVAAVMASGKSEAAAQRRFSRLANAYTPETSRKAKSNAAKAEAAANDDAGDDDDADDGAQVIRLSEKQLARNVLQATTFIAAWQAGEADSTTLGRLGELLAILSNTK